MKKHLIYTAPGLINPYWQQVLEPYTLASNFDERPEHYDVVWVLTAEPDWQQLISHFNQPHKIVIAMTRQRHFEELQLALEAGAQGYLDVMSAGDILLQAVKSIQTGSLWLPASLISNLTGALNRVLEQKKANKNVLSVLTAREKQVASCVLEGLTNKEVARKLEITERTVKEHLSTIFSKLGISDRFQLILKVHT